MHFAIGRLFHEENPEMFKFPGKSSQYRDSNEIEVEIAVSPPDASELTDEDQGYENVVNTGEITENDVFLTLWMLKLDIVSILSRALVCRLQSTKKS
ncbi:hypothetical protein TNCV_3691561 [Trichonephila clavipes]|nr:hypothetical protein TNCV_3691561 [Trichonephila clavipes]